MKQRRVFTKVLIRSNNPEVEPLVNINNSTILRLRHVVHEDKSSLYQEKSELKNWNRGVHNNIIRN